MIIDKLENAGRYYGNHPLFKQAFDYIVSSDLVNAENGTVQVSDGLKAIYSDAPGKTKDVSLEKFECHNQNIDIQVCIRGTETIGWKPRQDCTSPKGEYNAEKDVLFYNETPDMFFNPKDGQFAIFFPEDVHASLASQHNLGGKVMNIDLEQLTLVAQLEVIAHSHDVKYATLEIFSDNTPAIS